LSITNDDKGVSQNVEFRAYDIENVLLALDSVVSGGALLFDVKGYDGSVKRDIKVTFYSGSDLKTSRKELPGVNLDHIRIPHRLNEGGKKGFAMFFLCLIHEYAHGCTIAVGSREENLFALRNEATCSFIHKSIGDLVWQSIAPLNIIADKKAFSTLWEELSAKSKNEMVASCNQECLTKGDAFFSQTTKEFHPELAKSIEKSMEEIEVWCTESRCDDATNKLFEGLFEKDQRRRFCEAVASVLRDSLTKDPIKRRVDGEDLTYQEMKDRGMITITRSGSSEVILHVPGEIVLPWPEIRFKDGVNDDVKDHITQVRDARADIIAVSIGCYDIKMYLDSFCNLYKDWVDDEISTKHNTRASAVLLALSNGNTGELEQYIKDENTCISGRKFVKGIIDSWEDNRVILSDVVIFLRDLKLACDMRMENADDSLVNALKELGSNR